MTRTRWTSIFALPALAVALAAAGCGSDDNDKGSSGSAGGGGVNTKVSGKVSMIGIWAGAEQKSLRAVLDAFNKRYPNVKVKYTSGGDNVATVVSTAVEGGNPPDLATIAQPGLIKQFAKRGAIKNMEFARSTIEDNFPADVVQQGTIGGKLYSYIFKASNKSTVWFNVPSFKAAGVDPPANWDDFLKAAQTLKASGVPAYSLGAGDGWTLTDLFENIYLRQAGPEKYDQLSTHAIPWTDPSVKQALSTMAKVLGDTSNIAGGKAGALQNDFPKSVTQVITSKPKAAMVIEGDFVPTAIADKSQKAGTDYDSFAFPAINGSENAVVGGGDSLVMFRNTPAIRALVQFLATPEAQTVWVKRGGFSSANKNVDEADYPDELQRKLATAVAQADPFRFDMSDLAPASFGGTQGQGEWKLMQDFLSNPKDVDGTARKLEAAAKKAFS